MTEQKYVEIMAFFKGSPGDEKDLQCMKIFKDAGGRFVGCGTELGIMERDQCYEVPAHNEALVKKQLVEAGFSLTASPDNFAWGSGE